MAGRNLGHDAALHEFVGDLPAGPLADRATRRSRRGAGQFDDLANLGVGNPHGSAGARRIGQPLGDGAVGEGHCLQAEPALAPEAGHIETDAELAGNLAMVRPSGGGQDNPRAEGKLLGRGVVTDELVEAATLLKG